MSQLSGHYYVTDHEEDTQQNDLEDNINEQDEDNLEISNEIKRQYLNDQIENETNKKRNHSNQSNQSNHSNQSNQSEQTVVNTPTPRTKKRRGILPGGSDIEADNESDSGNHNMSKSYLHSTLREESPKKSNLRDLMRAKSIPETPNTTYFTTRYNSESAKSSQEETIKKITFQETEIGQNHG